MCHYNEYSCTGAWAKNKTKQKHVTHCSRQWNFNEQICSEEVGKIEEWSGTFVEERGGTRDTRWVWEKDAMGEGAHWLLLSRTR